jgi:hypothetical protein
MQDKQNIELNTKILIIILRFIINYFKYSIFTTFLILFSIPIFMTIVIIVTNYQLPLEKLIEFFFGLYTKYEINSKIIIFFLTLLPIILMTFINLFIFIIEKIIKKEINLSFKQKITIWSIIIIILNIIVSIITILNNEIPNSFLILYFITMVLAIIFLGLFLLLDIIKIEQVNNNLANLK